MFKKIIEKRALHYNKLRAMAIEKMKVEDVKSINYELAMMTKIQSEACLAELIIIQNELTLINFLSK